MTITAGLPALVAAAGMPAKDLSTQGLCSVAHKVNGSSGIALGSLSDPGLRREYEVHCVPDTSHAASSMSIAEILAKDRSRRLLRTERGALAATLATSCLQYFSTPWLPGVATANEIRVPVHPASGEVEYRYPFLVAKFQSPSSSSQDDIPFQELAIVLLELCFGRTLADHPMWKQEPTLSISHPISRKSVASEWYRDVKLEAGMDYYMAVDWCLHKASQKNPEWRIEFAQHVVNPLQKCYESMLATTVR